jgi:uncharacterized LabA/DUF88 family protein
MKRVAIFIDGNNFYYGLKKIYGEEKKLINFDFFEFCNFLTGKNELVGIFYYNAPLDKNKNFEKYKSQQRFFDKIKRIPKFRLILCKLLKLKIKETGEYYYIIKEDDIHMAVDLVKGAFKNIYDEAILVSGDGDFVPAVLASREEGKFIENVYFKRSASTNLKLNCNRSFELKKELLDRFFN